jgi:hypothetical protein
MVKYYATQFGEVPVRLTISCLKRFEQKTGRSIFGVDMSDMKIADIELLFFYSLQKGLRVTGTTLKHQDGTPVDINDPEVIEDIFDQCYVSFLKDMPSFFKEMGPKEAELVQEAKEESVDKEGKN